MQAHSFPGCVWGRPSHKEIFSSPLFLGGEVFFAVQHFFGRSLAIALTTTLVCREEGLLLSLLIPARFSKASALVEKEEMTCQHTVMSIKGRCLCSMQRSDLWMEGLIPLLCQ